MGTSWRRKGLRPVVLGVVVAGAASLSACATDTEPDLVAGKKAFVSKCGSCHVLERAGTKGTVGPNLDAALVRAKEDGFGEKSIEGMVRQQILYPSNDGTPESEVTGITGNGLMPANLVEGDTVTDVAAYVAEVAAEGGKDTGLLAEAVPAAGSNKPIVAANGVLSIPADPSGQLAYTSSVAQAKPGRLRVVMPNTSGVPHNIVIDGKGESPVVEQGEADFEAEFEPGEFTFYCSVPGHQEGGMEGKLTVK